MSHYDGFRDHLNRFTLLTDKDYLKIIEHLKQKKISKNQVLIRENEYVHFTYWVIKGLIISTFIDEKGKEYIIQFAIENCWITDQDAFYNQGKASYRITSLENSEVLALSYESREKLCKEIPGVANFFRKKANDSFVKQQKRLLTYLTSDAQRRYDLLIKEYPTLLQRISKKRLAAYLGVSRETLSRFTRK